MKDSEKPLLPAYTILHGLLPVSFPCCDPTTFYHNEGQRKTLAASLHNFARLIARFIPLLRSYDVFMTPLRSSRRNRAAGSFYGRKKQKTKTPENLHFWLLV
jgi:hypothetical protein